MTAHDRLILDNPGAGWPADMVEAAEARHDAERRAVLRPVEEHEATLSDSDSDDSADGAVILWLIAGVIVTLAIGWGLL